MKEIPLLKANQIECRIGTITSKGYSILLYKTARTDMDILDEVYGQENWQRDHKELKDNMYCGIGIWCEDKKQWIWKWDAGKESQTESEKGEASDSFKRAGVNIGIGRELYTSPFIWITPISKDEIYTNDKGKLATKTILHVDLIDYNDNKEINKLIIKDIKGNIRFTYGDVKIDITNDMMITEGQIQQIALSINEEQLKKLEEKYGELNRLTYKKAQELIDKLNDRKNA